MAWYDVTYACGHSGREQLYGTSKERERRLASLSKCLCEECSAKFRQESISQKVAISRDLGLPDLTGSDKQVDWALTIRESFLTDWGERKNAVDKQRKTEPEDRDAEYAVYMDVLALAKEQALAHTSAHWWIDNRIGLLSQAIREAKRSYDAQATNRTQATDHTQVAAVAKEEAIVRPQDQVKSVVPEILVTDNEIMIQSPKDEDLRQIVRNLGYRFSDGCWRKKITMRTGTAADRAAEVGNALLLAGFAVMIYDADIRQKAIRADFAPECHKWVSVIDGGQHDGWFCISFPRGKQELYDAARKIAGSRWDSPYVVVPTQYYQQVADFAETLGFGITPSAKEIIEIYQSRSKGPVQIARPVPVPEQDKLGDILHSSAEIVPDLLDD